MEDSTAPSRSAAVQGDVVEPVASTSPPFDDQQPPPKLKGRQRLVAGLKRISSSQSIARLSATRSRAYSAGGKGSTSCISLASTSTVYSPSYGTPFTPEQSHSLLTTAPTSAAAAAITPGSQIPSSIDELARVRCVPKSEHRDTAALPSDLRSPLSRAIQPSPPAAELHDDEQQHHHHDGGGDYFSRPVTLHHKAERDFNFWRDLPAELRMEILTYLKPREVVRCSIVSRNWHQMCFDGQLWSILDTADFYQDIPAKALVDIILSAGPFVRDLNLRGCVQLRDLWHARGLSDVCRNLENFSLEGCRIDRTAIHNFLYQNRRLVHLNLCGLAGATNAAMKIIAVNCPKLEHLNVSWCNNIDTRGLKKIVEGCTNLRDLRAGEIRGWDDIEFAQLLFERNTLERLILINCDTLTDEALAVMIEGRDSETDYLSGRPIVPPRRLKHLDLTRCRGITDQGVRTFVNNIPEMEGLQLSKLHGIVDATLTELLPTVPMLTHLDLEELEDLTNVVLQTLSTSPCASRLRHLSISYCESLGDTGMLPILRACTNLRSLEMDNTRVSDLVLAEAAAMVRQRVARTVVQGNALFKPAVGLNLVAYDCQNVTWTGVREILHRNAETVVKTSAHELPPLPRPASANDSEESSRPTSPPRIHILRTTSYPSQIIQLKCFFTYQPTVEEHTKRVLRGDFLAAKRLEKKWAEFMIAQEEAGAAGAGIRRRRRRAREAQMMHADEEDSSSTSASQSGPGVGGGRRRRARSGGCAVM